MSWLWWTLGAVIVGSMLLVFSAWVFGDEWLVWRARRKKLVVFADPIVDMVRYKRAERVRLHKEWNRSWISELSEPERAHLHELFKTHLYNSGADPRYLDAEVYAREHEEFVGFVVQEYAKHLAGGTVIGLEQAAAAVRSEITEYTVASMDGTVRRELVASYHPPVPPRGPSGVKTDRAYGGDLRIQAELLLAQKQKLYGLSVPQRFPVDEDLEESF